MYAVQPRVLPLGRRGKDRRSADSGQPRRAHLPAAGVGHVDVLVIVGLQHDSHVDNADAVGAQEEPVSAAREDSALQARAFKFARSHGRLREFHRVYLE